MGTLAVFWEGDMQGWSPPSDLTLFLIRVKDKMGGLYEIWGVSNEGTVAKVDKPITLDVTQLPINQIFSLEEYNNEPRF